MKWSISSKICFFIIWLVFSICIILTNTGKVSITYSGFAVDSSGILYVGKEGVIEKYDGNKMIGEISPQTSRGYAFTVKEDDTILLSTADVVYKLDLSGNVLDEWEDEGTSTFNDLQFIRKFVAKDGRQYVMKLHFGRTVICSGDDVIYKMPMLDYIVRILWWSCFVGAFVLGITLFIQWLKDYNNKTNKTSIQPISLEKLFNNYKSSFSHCGEFLLDLSDEEIDNYVFEEFDIDATTFLHENTLDRLIEAKLITESEYKKSQELRHRFMELQNTDLFNVEAVKTAEEWREIMKLADEIYDSIQKRM